MAVHVHLSGASWALGCVQAVSAGGQRVARASAGTLFTILWLRLCFCASGGPSSVWGAQGSWPLLFAWTGSGSLGCDVGCPAQVPRSAFWSPFPVLTQLGAMWLVPTSWGARGMGSCQVCGRGLRWSAGHAGVPFLLCGRRQSNERYFLEMCVSYAGNFPGLDLGDIRNYLQARASQEPRDQSTYW